MSDLDALLGTPASPSVALHAGDNRATLRRLIDEGVRVHSVVTDPPYGLTSVVKRFGKKGAAAARTDNNDGSFARLSGGFMGKAWDGSGIERDPEFWRLIYDILLPGGFVFAFSASRTGHWQACAMEQAGFIMHPMHGWCYGSGFPKAHNAAKAIEAKLLTGGSGPKNSAELTTPEAQQWEGWAYGTQTQKPALEPIYLGQRPMAEKTGAANLLEHGVGAFNIDGCRVPAPGEEISNHARSVESAVSKGKYSDSAAQETHQTAGQALGRHPANLLHDGSDDVVAMFPDSKGQIARSSSSSSTRKTQSCYGEMRRGAPGTEMEPRNDSGSAARFFHSFPPDCDPLFYHPKAGKTDRAGSKHPTVKPVALMQYLIRHITPPGGVVLDPFAGSGTTAEAARREGFDCILMEAEVEYLDFLRERFDLPPPDTDPLMELIG